MKRFNKKFQSLFTLIVLLLSFSCNRGKEDEKEKGKSENSVDKPNVVFILADDLGLHDLSVTGSGYYETPNIDKIANEGTIFTQGYAGCRVCSPSRATIMTGQFTARHGITDWIGAASGEQWRENGHNNKILPPNYKHGLDTADITIAEAFNENGYQTFFAGKWHLGADPDNPEHNGFDVNKGGWEVGNPKGGYFSPWINPKLENEKPGENLSMRLARETSAFIESNQDKPFFAYLSFYAVHSPIQTSEMRWKKYRDKANAEKIPNSGFEMERILPHRVVQDNPVYAGLIEQMDDAVGIVLNKLKELGLDKNTIVVFTSDNGGVTSGDAYSTTNLPLRGGKGYQWEGGIREPYFIKVPFLKNVPKKIDYPVTGADFYPTLLDFANLPQHPEQSKDGVSLKPLFDGKKLEDRPLFWHYPHYGNQGGEPSSSVRHGNFKLIHYWEDGHNELYNIKEDVGEQNNIAAANPDLTKKMYEELDNFLSEVNADRPVKDKDYNEKKAEELYARRKNVLLPKLEKERKEMLSEDFKPNETWWDSKLTKD